MRPCRDGGRVRKARSYVRLACVWERIVGHWGWLKIERYISHSLGSYSETANISVKVLEGHHWDILLAAT
jgi:hypothetical protein